MTRQLLILAFIFSVTHSFGQKENENDFYTFLQSQIKQAINKEDSIVITEEAKACFGSTWKAVLKPKANYTNISFYVDRMGSITDTSSDLFQTIIDTSFSLPTNTLMNNLESEIQYLKSNIVLSHTTTQYLIEQGNKKRKFKLEKGQGLYYWLRYNKSWTAYLADR